MPFAEAFVQREHHWLGRKWQMACRLHVRTNSRYFSRKQIHEICRKMKDTNLMAFSGFVCLDSGGYAT